MNTTVDQVINMLANDEDVQRQNIRQKCSQLAAFGVVQSQAVIVLFSDYI